MVTGNYAGIDWASGGWLAVTVDSGRFDCNFESKFDDLWQSLDDPTRVLIDIPMVSRLTAAHRSPIESASIRKREN